MRAGTGIRRALAPAAGPSPAGAFIALAAKRAVPLTTANGEDAVAVACGRENICITSRSGIPPMLPTLRDRPASVPHGCRPTHPGDTLRAGIRGAIGQLAQACMDAFLPKLGAAALTAAAPLFRSFHAATLSQ